MESVAYMLEQLNNKISSVDNKIDTSILPAISELQQQQSSNTTILRLIGALVVLCVPIIATWALLQRNENLEMRERIIILEERLRYERSDTHKNRAYFPTDQGKLTGVSYPRETVGFQRALGKLHTYW